MTRLTRRRFLQSAAVAAAVPWAARLRGDTPPPSNRLRVAMIGVAHQGGHDLHRIAEAGAIAVLCDVDETFLAAARKSFPKAEVATDFRRVVDRKDIDAVAVGIPDHVHAIATLLALQAGKHVFCEKPLTHNIVEARKVTEAAKKYNRVTQIGTQIHAGDNYRRVVELIRAGAIGPIREADAWIGRSNTNWSGGVVPTDEPPVPPGLHYDLWLGPAPERPYSPGYLPKTWRGWWDFGGGTLADMGCHFYDLIQWSLELHAPARVSAEGPPVDPHSAPPWLTVRYDYPAAGGRPPLTVHWSSGRPPTGHEKLIEKEKYTNGVLFVGEAGMLLTDYTRHKLLPEDKFAGYTPPPKSIRKSIGHYKEWVEACKGNGTTTCHFGYSGPLTETVLLGNVAYRAGTPIEWDAAAMRIPNAPHAERFLRREYRGEWGKVMEGV